MKTKQQSARLSQDQARRRPGRRRLFDLRLEREKERETVISIYPKSLSVILRKREGKPDQISAQRLGQRREKERDFVFFIVKCCQSCLKSDGRVCPCVSVSLCPFTFLDESCLKELNSFFSLSLSLLSFKNSQSDGFFFFFASAL